MTAAELSLPKTLICVRTSVRNFIPIDSLPVIHFQMLYAVLHLRWYPTRDSAVVYHKIFCVEQCVWLSVRNTVQFVYFSCL